MIKNKGSLKLRAIDPIEDSHTIKDWFEDPLVTKYMVYGQRPQTSASISEWLKNDVKNNNDVFAIMYNSTTGPPIGLAGLYSISQTARSAELRILIGNKGYWNKGIGTDIISMLLFYAFDRLNLNSVWLGVTDGNEPAIKAYKKCGFVENGRRRDALYRNGRYYDAIWLDIIRLEYMDKYYEEHKESFGV